MNKILVPLIFIVLLTSLVSAELIIDQQPETIYNLGDLVSVPITIKVSTDISSSLQMDLVCSGKEINFYKNGISLKYGEELKLSPAPSLVLTNEIIGNVKGNCKIKVMLVADTQLTEEFKISDLIILKVTEKQTEFKPGESILIEGEAIKENGKSAEGFVDLEIIIDPTKNESGRINQIAAITNGYFSINITLPTDMKAGEHLLNLNAYERDLLGEESNKGFTYYGIDIKQVPTNLEIVFEEQNVKPGTDLKVKAILHDQTGEKIDSSAIITIKNQNNKILEQIEVPTDEFLLYPIVYNEPPANWKVVAVSNQLTGEAAFEIIENQEVSVELVNKTIIVKNIGNVEYCNKTILVKIGNQSLDIDDCLKVDEVQRYLLTAPDGRYQVEIIKDGESIITGEVALTGKTTSVKKTSKGLKGFPVVWVFVIIILGFVAFIVYKKGYRKSFFGRIHIKKKDKKTKKLEEHRSAWKRAISASARKKPLINLKNKAEVSISLKGTKQNASVVCLHLKNHKDLLVTKGNIEETLQKIVHYAEEKNAFIYDNHDNIFFILSPTKTKTFRNEKAAIKLAGKIRHILAEYNRLSKQKIEFGLSLNYGEIVAKSEQGILKFMSMGRAITSARKVASLSDGEVLLTKEMDKKLGSNVKTIKHEKDKTEVYTIKEMRDKENHRAFISSFLKRLEDEKKKK